MGQDDSGLPAGDELVHGEESPNSEGVDGLMVVDDSGDVDLDDGVSRALGLERYVQFAFLAVGIVVFFVVDKLATETWSLFAEPDPTVITLVSALVGILVAIMLYRRASTREVAQEVATEVSRVTWPQRAETWSATVVVVVTSLIAAFLLGGIDRIWLYLTDAFYSGQFF